MKQLTQKIDIKSLLLSLVLICTLAVVYVISVMPAAQVHGDSTNSHYAVNENGQTYGTTGNAQSYETEPDLIAALATNGQEGYVYKTDLYAAEGHATSPEHAVELMHYKAGRCADAFINTIKDLTGADLSENRDAIVEYMLYNSGIFGQMNTIPTEHIVDLKQIIPVEVGNQGLALAMESARMANVTVIPVYLSDGETIIGEFICY